MPPEIANQPGVQRTETGEIESQVGKTEETKSTTPETKVETKIEPTTKEDDKSLLNKEDKTPTGAPEKYEDFQVPEGFVLDEAIAKEAGELFKGLNVSQEGAQKLVDFYIAKTQEAADAPIKFWSEKQAKWQADMKADKEIGSRLPLVKQTISKAIDGLGDPKLAAEFREAMDYTGAGNNVAFAKVFFKLAEMVTEGTHVAAGGPSKLGQKPPGTGPTDAAHAMYPHLS